MMVIKNPTVRKILKFLIPALLIPLVIIIGVTLLKQKHYALVASFVALLSLLLFAAGYEKKKTGSRRMVIVAVMITLSVVGRFIPLFKPVTALTIITAVWLGGEAGFLVGAMSALISNFYFGQGPWTPFQMFAWGLIGLIAGLLSVPLKKHRLLMTLYGLFSGMAYSFVMDIWTVLWYDKAFSAELYWAALLTAVPYTILYSVSNVIFLWLLAKPFGEKLERIKVKYGV